MRITHPYLIILLAVFSIPVGCGNRTNKDVDSNKFADHVRNTEFQTPEAEMAGFKVPPGFEITLFAAEPDITKPINMEFDDQGRLWVTQSSEYPIAAGQGAGRDRISILEDSDGDGRADVFTHFDDSLNIPIGIMPVADGAVGFSIPNVYRFTDRDGDGISDGKSVLLGPFGYKDTHGMVNNFFRGFDGWIHACHGFTNSSTVAGSDGDSITMVSGNTFRFQPDGSRVEQTTNGRINPFGSAMDERGYLYSVDCHSKPIFQLIPGGDYPQWGRKDPAIGYAPEMMSYELGSTALSGLVYYTDTQFPETYRNSFFTGDVVTCRIDRNTVSYQGSTPIAKKEEPFLTSEDPWFRPVDIKTGPDGSLYIADFYNRIIGHYEVALDHPGRDRLSGRIWKITYTGKDRGAPAPVKNWAEASLSEVVEGLNHPHLGIRLKLADRLVEVFKNEAVQPVEALIGSPNVAPTAYIHGLWVLYRLGALSDGTLHEALSHHDPIVRQHALRILAEEKSLDQEQEAAVLENLKSEDPFLQRTAAEVLKNFSNAKFVSPLLATYQESIKEDSHLRYTALLAIRNNLRGKGVAEAVASGKWKESDLAVLAMAMRDVPSSAAASFVLDYVRDHQLPQDVLQSSLEFVGRYSSPAQLDQTVAIITERFKDDYQTQLSLFLNINEGIAQRGSGVTPKLAVWGKNLSDYFLQGVTDREDAWMSKPMDASKKEDLSPWKVSDGFLVNVMPAFRIYFSERNGYQPMATLYSKPFALPNQLRMNVFDNDLHNREEKVGVSRNVVRIRLAGSDQIVGEYRMASDKKVADSELIRQATFSLDNYQGQMGYIEVVDSITSGAIGIGKLDPEVVEMPPYTPSDIDELRQNAAEIAGSLKITALRSRLVDVVKAAWIGVNTRVAAANALANMPAKEDTDLFGNIFTDKATPALLREHLAINLGQLRSDKALSYLQKGVAGSSRAVQLAAATALASSPAGIDRLLDALDAGELPADLAAEFKVKEALAANGNTIQQGRIAAILAKGEDEREARKNLIETRIAKFQDSGQRKEKGKVLFEANCASCHQVSGSGGMIGPQLDGIGNWGVRALTEKILDPNRNISESFRTYNIVLDNGKQQSGLYRRTEGEVMVFADITGKEFKVVKKDMKSYTPSPYTLMPDQFRHTLSEDEFSSLMEYLLTVK